MSTSHTAQPLVSERPRANATKALVADALRQMVAGLGPNIEVRTIRVVSDGDLVAAHSLYRGLGPQPVVAFEVFRVEGSRLAKQSNAHQPLEERSVNGHTQIDGPTEIVRPGQTEVTRRLVEEFMDTVVIPVRYDQLPRFCAAGMVQHNPTVHDGVAGLSAALAEHWRQLEFQRRHFTVADGDFALTATEGRMGGKRTAFYDLFRVLDEMIVEHWDVVNEIRHNGPF